MVEFAIPFVYSDYKFGHRTTLSIIEVWCKTKNCGDTFNQPRRLVIVRFVFKKTIGNFLNYKCIVTNHFQIYDVVTLNLCRVFNNFVKSKSLKFFFLIDNLFDSKKS